MWSEEQDNIDNRIRKAADSVHHQPDDKHWEKMATLLDEHLPVEKKRRRFLFILLLAGLLTGAGVITMITFSKKQNGAVTVTNTSKPVNAKTDNNEQKINTRGFIPQKDSTTDNTPTLSGKEKKADIIPATEGKIEKPVENERPLLTTVTKKQKQYKGNKLIIDKKKNERTQAIGFTQKTGEISTITNFGNGRNTSADTEISTVNSKDSQATIAATELPETTIQEDKKEDSISTADNKEEKASTAKNKQTKFSLLLSAGSDISGIGTKAGSPQIAYGIGVAYSLSNRWTIRTGLLAAVKKYDAKPQQYHPDNYNFWVYYPRMQKIDADCFVYEIPLSIVYNFNSRKNHNWFVSTGVSSFIMKRETYGYTYKDNWGQTRYTTRTYKNEYRHWFSVLNISGGYQYRFNNKFSLLAEPYIKMPLAGVGFGQVKLNSAGILITASIKPFSKKEK